MGDQGISVALGVFRELAAFALRARARRVSYSASTQSIAAVLGSECSTVFSHSHKDSFEGCLTSRCPSVYGVT